MSVIYVFVDVQKSDFYNVRLELEKQYFQTSPTNNIGRKIKITRLVK